MSLVKQAADKSAGILDRVTGAAQGAKNALGARKMDAFRAAKAAQPKPNLSQVARNSFSAGNRGVLGRPKV